MTIRDQIAAVLSDGTKTSAQKDATVGVLKRDAAAASLQGKLPHTFTRGNIAVTITAVDTGPNAIHLSYEVRRNGVLQPIDPRHVIVNMPMLVDDPAGDVSVTDASGGVRRLRESPLDALKEVVANRIAGELR